jgi:hypothetical protein
MKNKVEENYLHLLESVRDNPKPFSKHEGKKLVAHYPMRGSADEVDIMFIGRALNDWTWQFDVPTPEEDLNDLLLRIKANVAEDADPEYVYSEREQLKWVDDRNAKHKDYNSNRSQFWQTIREIMQGRVVDKDDWWHGIVWSNFLKLSRPKKNPTAGMVGVIGESSMELLLAEIREYEPKHIVCLSGMDYAANLLARCEVSQRVADIENTRYIEYSGLVTLAGERNISLLIVPHPQGKGKIRSLMVEEITTQLSKLEVLKKRYE